MSKAIPNFKNVTLCIYVSYRCLNYPVMKPDSGYATGHPVA